MEARVPTDRVVPSREWYGLLASAMEETTQEALIPEVQRLQAERGQEVSTESALKTAINRLVKGHRTGERVSLELAMDVASLLGLPPPVVHIDSHETHRLFQLVREVATMPGDTAARAEAYLRSLLSRSR